MGKVTVQKSGSKYIIENKLTYPEVINERIMTALSRGKYERLMPITFSSKKKESIIRAVATDYVPLAEYFSGLVSKKMFLDFILEVIAVIKESDDNFGNATNLDLDMSRIFVNMKTKGIMCLYWPVVNNYNARPPIQFLKDLPFQLVFNKYENTSYVTEYIKYMKNSTKSMSIKSFEKMIKEMAGIATKTEHEPTGSTAYGGNGFEQKETENKKDSRIEYNPLDNINNQPDEYIHKKEENIPSDYYYSGRNDNGTCVLSGETERKENYVPPTSLLDSQINFQAPVFPYLIRVKNNEKIPVNKPSFRIGKEKSFCDYFVSDNSAVSRSHADIITSEGRYYIIDNNSTNKTYVDGKVVPINIRVELFAGSKIRLANEDFVFYQQ